MLSEMRCGASFLERVAALASPAQQAQRLRQWKLLALALRGSCWAASQVTLLGKSVKTTMIDETEVARDVMVAVCQELDLSCAEQVGAALTRRPDLLVEALAVAAEPERKRCA